MSADNSKYRYIFNKEALNAIPIEDVLVAGGCETNGKYIYCPFEHKKPARLKIFKDDSTHTNSCQCHNCKQPGKGTPEVMAEHFKGSWYEGMKWLTETFNIAMILNPDYCADDGYDNRKKQRNGAASLSSNKPLTPKSYEVTYMEFDPSKPYKKVVLNAFIGKYKELSKEQRLKMVYTYLYRYSLTTQQKAKFGYYKNRAIDTKNPQLQKIGYLPHESFPLLLEGLLRYFSKEDLIEFGVINSDDDEKHPGEWKFHYVKKGGLLVVPSFDLYSDMVTGFMLRPTHPPHWMVDKKIKELQLSCTHIIKPLPFGLTYETLTSNGCIYTTEGHPDGLALPETVSWADAPDDLAIPQQLKEKQGCHTHCISTAGVNGFDEEMLGLLKGKTVFIAYDQDRAGRIGTFGFIELQSKEGKFEYPDDKQGYEELTLITKRLELNGIKFMQTQKDGILQKMNKAGANAIPLVWDEKLGGDVNELRINGNIEKVFKS